jgi:putative membrane protein
MNLMQSTRGISAIVGILLLAGMPVIAQQSGMGAPAGPAQQQPGQMGSPDAATMASADSGQPMANYAEQSFVEDTLKSDDAQVAMSQLAQQKSTSDDIKVFGQKMVQVHTQLDSQFKPVAKQLDVSEPKGPAKKEKQEIAKLETLSGPQFDSEYILAMAREQQHSLKEFQNEAKMNQNSSAQQVAKMDEPVLTQHFQILEKLAQDHNVPLDNADKK